MEIRIRNVLGLDDVRLKLHGLTLVAGLNGAGKTSLLQSVAAAALGDWKIRGVTKKAEAEHLVRRGAAEGSILFDYKGGAVRISYPDGKVDQQGNPPEFGTALGMGVQRFALLPREQRGREIAQRFQTDPTREDFDAWWASHADAGLDPAAPPASSSAGTALPRAIDVLWDDIGVSGWDAVAKRIESGLRMLTGQWYEATGERWGSKVRLTWAPAGLFRGEDYSVEEARKALDEARRKLERALRADAVDEAERERLKAVAEPLGVLRKEVGDLEAQAEKLNAAVEAAIADIEKTPEPIDPRTIPICPECSKPLRIVRSPTGGLTVEKAAGRPLSLKAFEDEKNIRAALLEVRGTRTAAASAHGTTLAAARQKLADAERAKAALDAMDGKPARDAEGLVAARAEQQAAETRHKAVAALARAIEINAEWEMGSAILEGLVPSGIRALVLNRKLAEINQALAAEADRAGMHEVGLTNECGLTYDGRAYEMLSESEQWRCDLAMGLLLAKHEKARIYLVDRLDLLHAQSREGVLRALAGSGMAVLVTMTARENKPGVVPDLGAAKLGRSIWLGAGRHLDPQGA